MENQNKTNLGNWANNLVSNTEQNLSKELFKSLLLNSRSWDIFSSWILLISGATFTLIVPNIESLKAVINLTSIRLFLIFLGGSSILGIISKYFSTIIDVLFNVTTSLENQFPRILDEFEAEKAKIADLAQQNGMSIPIDINITRVMTPIVSQFPKIYHRFIWKACKDGEKDLLLNYKKATKFLIKRGFFVTMQIALFAIAFLIIVLNIKNF